MNSLSPIRPPVKEQLKQLYLSSGPAIVVFMNEWCPACQEYKPILEFFSEKYEDRVGIYVIRSEEAMAVTGLPTKGITSIPYSFFLLGRAILAEVPGALRFLDFDKVVKTLYRSFVDEESVQP